MGNIGHSRADVVWEMGLGPGHVPERPMSEKLWRPGQVIKKAFFGGRLGNSGDSRADVVCKLGLVPGHAPERPMSQK